MNFRYRYPLLLCMSLLLSACQTGTIRPDHAAPPATPAPTTEAPASPTMPSPAVTETPADTNAGTAPAEVPTTTANGTLRGETVFARLRQDLSPDACAAGDSARQWRQRYAGNPRAFAQHLEQILPLLDFVSRETERDQLPAEFALIPIIESWYQPDAMGRGGPAGMWQMIGSTARNHGIHIQSGYDGRLSPVESTRAALSYLKTLQGMFDGWQATIMAYNAGEGRVLKAYKRNGSRETSGARRLPKGLSNITYDYIAKVQALSCLISEPQQQNLQLPLAKEFLPLSAVLIAEDVHSLDQVAHSRGINAADLQRLNPGFRSGHIVAGVPRLVLMPAGELITAVPDNASAQFADTEGDAGGPQTHRVRKGDTVWTIAKHYGLSIQQLLQLNNLGRKAKLRPGQTLKILP
ncbi:MAG TPA: transglycosylase SLT domain-containing protein [Arenimonas sp.]|uniref:transglycosylase SLT domain-containing protein n=1 Tax=Arenimonas sp. TaxID=1872635 RepID=UPI002C7BA4DA|nr:transglycosylase SLT domain-containing protein [Arenimonas sp.]HMB57866.1 transglycosylase SLT domain-containing protein [Arenimonas sp.]